ncbi:hypothetical protein DER44DRAFT_741908 [Fusarium oxysporum]|nr:hypothetical protein DER44DRAFT_741908 [Fusarium oxysporum]
MATVEVDGILDSLAQGYDESQFQSSICLLIAHRGRESSPSDQQTPRKSILLPAPDVQLRSASRDSKNRKRRGAAPSNQAHARESHNLIERHYRARLKTQFERLLAVLPAAQALSLADKDTAPNLGQVLSRGQVLDMARNRILELEGKLEVILTKRRGGYYV